MIIIDTDHLAVLRYADHPRYAALCTRLEDSGEALAVTVVTWEEQHRGWLAEIHRCRHFADQVAPYDRLLKLAEFIMNGMCSPSPIKPLSNVSDCERKRCESAVRI